MMLHRVFACSLMLICSTSLLPFNSIFSAESSLTVVPDQTDADLLLTHLIDDLFNKQLKFDPEASTFLGRDDELDSLWSDLSDEDTLRRIELIESLSATFRSIDATRLSEERLIDYELIRRTLKESLDFLNTDLYLLPLSQMGGPPLDVFPVLQAMPCRTLTHYNRILDRLKGLPKLIDQTISLMQKGIEKGITYPKSALWSLPVNLEKMIASSPEESNFYKVLKELNDCNADQKTEANKIRQAALFVISDEIYPSYLKLVDFIRDVYIPGCRDEAGFSALPQGQILYRLLVEKYTTTSLAPADIHQLGLNEVERIHQEMNRVVDDSGYEGSVESYMNYLATDPEFYFTDKESLINGYKELTESIQQQLANNFGLLPALPFEVLPIPSHSEEGQITAYYMQGSVKAGRPGRFFVNTFDIGTRPKWQMESLALHEAVPGHHFQLSLAQELEGLSEFRKHYGCTAFIEGWGLYSESLGPDFGLGKTPSARFGRLIEEMMRAVRLVVDTGIHEYGWSRDKAVNYMMEHTGFQEREAATEIDRYCVMPAQALAYKVGELSMQRWKREAKHAFGDAFDIRRFHDILLGHGTLPLDLCEEIIYRWIETSGESY